MLTNEYIYQRAYEIFDIIMDKADNRPQTYDEIILTLTTVNSLIENKIEIHSFLSLEIKNKGVYEDVPNILYALLLFITGAEGAGDIKIAGLSLDDLTT